MRARKLRSNFFLKKSTNSFISWLMFSASSKMDSVFFPWGGPQKIEILNFWEKSIPFHPELTYHKLSQHISEPPPPPSIPQPIPDPPTNHSESYTIPANPNTLQSWTIPTYLEPSPLILNHPKISQIHILNRPRLSRTIPTYPGPSPPIPDHPPLSRTIPTPIPNHPHPS